MTAVRSLGTTRVLPCRRRPLVAKVARTGDNLTGLEILTDELDLTNLQLLNGGHWPAA